jgi:hypothetical protein
MTEGSFSVTKGGFSVLISSFPTVKLVVSNLKFKLFRDLTKFGGFSPEFPILAFSGRPWAVNEYETGKPWCATTGR